VEKATHAVWQRPQKCTKRTKTKGATHVLWWCSFAYRSPLIPVQHLQPLPLWMEKQKRCWSCWHSVVFCLLKCPSTLSSWVDAVQALPVSSSCLGNKIMTQLNWKLGMWIVNGAQDTHSHTHTHSHQQPLYKMGGQALARNQLPVTPLVCAFKLCNFIFASFYVTRLSVSPRLVLPISKHL